MDMTWLNYVQVRIEAASTIAAMLEGQALVLTQVAEYKESSKLGSFTTLSCSLGQILMQLHTGRGVADIFIFQWSNILWLSSTRGIHCWWLVSVIPQISGLFENFWYFWVLTLCNTHTSSSNKRLGAPFSCEFVTPHDQRAHLVIDNNSLHK